MQSSNDSGYRSLSNYHNWHPSNIFITQQLIRRNSSNYPIPLPHNRFTLKMNFQSNILITW